MVRSQIQTYRKPSLRLPGAAAIATPSTRAGHFWAISWEIAAEEGRPNGPISVHTLHASLHDFIWTALENNGEKLINIPIGFFILLPCSTRPPAIQCHSHWSHSQHTLSPRLAWWWNCTSHPQPFCLCHLPLELDTGPVSPECLYYTLTPSTATTHSSPTCVVKLLFSQTGQGDWPVALLKVP